MPLYASKYINRCHRQPGPFKSPSSVSNSQPSTMSSGKLGLSSTGSKRSLQPPSPSPSNASNASHGTPSSKRQKREAEAGKSSIRNLAAINPTPAAAAAANVNFGDDIGTQISFAVTFLKNKGAPKTLQEVLEHLSMQHTAEAQQKRIALRMRNHPQISFIAEPKKKGGDGDKEKAQPSWRTGRYEHVAKIPGVKSKATLLEYLQRKTDASKLEVKDLKDGWPDCDKAIDELEAEHKLLVVRTKKDGHAKFVWIDSPELFHPVDAEFRNMWLKAELPSLDDIVRKLKAAGQKPASDDPRLKVKETAKSKQKKRKTNLKKANFTNTHMLGMLQDYSHLRR
ncbi:uncharacterized protein BCR38DRAFT_459034 [Pseudomassariella vexata]|uniref:TFIIE beta domain-containing protein n=1 Tax=Pseudomassariella vexata TaxID=1141098 RepID=A0A1Y2DTF8_9PEZI|nr:uncharacterized protein BCR38DRAFT_459034 [Pseudomassariella vexata]ORY62561.1 hypothetical protein BCR38DRAFT_459034 [Pseudomassariella vexata]